MRGQVTVATGDTSQGAGGIGTTRTSCGVAALFTDAWMEENGADSALPILQQTFSNFLNSIADALGSSLDNDDTLGRLRKHLFLSHHSGAGRVLNSFYFETTSPDDCAHEVVRYEKAD